jgi:hypothetical protein
MLVHGIFSAFDRRLPTDLDFLGLRPIESNSPSSRQRFPVTCFCLAAPTEELTDRNPTFHALGRKAGQRKSRTEKKQDRKSRTRKSKKKQKKQDRRT